MTICTIDAACGIRILRMPAVGVGLLRGAVGVAQPILPRHVLRLLRLSVRQGHGGLDIGGCCKAAIFREDRCCRAYSGHAACRDWREQQAAKTSPAITQPGQIAPVLHLQHVSRTPGCKLKAQAHAGYDRNCDAPLFVERLGARGRTFPGHLMKYD